jgi:L-fuconolactonase
VGSACSSARLDFHARETLPSSGELTRAYKPYLDTYVAAFGTDPGMFESIFPPEGVSSSYAVLWNAFMRLAVGFSADDKAKLFSGTASASTVRPERSLAALESRSGIRAVIY